MAAVAQPDTNSLVLNFMRWRFRAVPSGVVVDIALKFWSKRQMVVPMIRAPNKSLDRITSKLVGSRRAFLNF